MIVDNLFYFIETENNKNMSLKEKLIDQINYAPDLRQKVSNYAEGSIKVFNECVITYGLNTFAAVREIMNEIRFNNLLPQFITKVEAHPKKEIQPGVWDERVHCTCEIDERALVGKAYEIALKKVDEKLSDRQL